MSNPWHKRLARSALIQHTLGNTLAGYLWFVDRTVRKVQADLDFPRSDLSEHLPFIMTFWHGEHFMVAPAAPRPWNLHVMISKSADGSINAIAARRFGIQPIRGAGDPGKRKPEKGGARAFLRFLSVLNEGGSVAQTADIPKIARQVSPGLVRLARKSGRPIVPAVYATHPRVTLNSWDRASVALPFSKAAVGTGAPIYIPAEASDDQSDASWCAHIGDRLNALETHAFAAIGGRSSFERQEPTGRGTAHG